MIKHLLLRRVVAVAAVLGVLVPIGLLIRALLLGRLFGSTLELLLYPGSIFLFDESRHSSLHGLTTFGLSLMATVALYVFAAMILFGIFRGIVSAWRLCVDVERSNESMKPTADCSAVRMKNKMKTTLRSPCRDLIVVSLGRNVF
jgi:hypothetical protein